MYIYKKKYIYKYKYVYPYIYIYTKTLINLNAWKTEDMIAILVGGVKK